LATSQDSGCGSTRIVVAVVDTGITAEVRTDGWLTDVARGPADIDQTDIMAPIHRLDWFAGHGTFTAGIVQQVAPSSEISVFRFTTGDGIGTDRDLADALIRAAHLADDPNVRLVINMSVGTPGVGGLAPLALQEAVEFVAAQYPDVVMVASAGNNGTDEKMYPAAFDQVVGVAAVKADLQPAAFSSFGSWVTCSCVGAGVVSTFVEGVMPPEPLAAEPDAVFGPDAFAVWSGTSFTAPQISGAIARLCQMNDCSPPRALEILLEDKKPLDGFGLLVDVLLPGTPE
jgi:subtilisin family serine protease